MEHRIRKLETYLLNQRERETCTVIKFQLKPQDGRWMRNLKFNTIFLFFQRFYSELKNKTTNKKSSLMRSSLQFGRVWDRWFKLALKWLFFQNFPAAGRELLFASENFSFIFWRVVKLYKQMKLQNMPENTILHLADIVQENSNSRTKMKIKIFFERKKFVRKSVAPKKGSPNL